MSLFTKKILNTMEKYKDKVAIVNDNEYIDYKTLLNKSRSIAYELTNNIEEDDFVLIIGHKSFSLYESVLGMTLASITFIPLNTKFPINKNMSIIEKSKVKNIIVCPEAVEYFKDLQIYLNDFTIYLFKDDLNVNNKIILKLDKYTEYKEKRIKDKPLYILFTSGTTGNPKGVVINRDNVRFYIDRILKKFKINHTDKISQIFEITFDLSMHDIFSAFTSGATLYIFNDKDLFNPVNFIYRNQLTIFFSVPSMILIMDKYRLLKDNILPSLRLSLFCGEPFYRFYAEKWKKSACNSEIYNLYGPTEATIAFTYYKYSNQNIKEKNGILSIGQQFDNLFLSIRDKSGKEVSEGEIWLGGNQIARGYLYDEKLTNEKFIYTDENGIQIKWYKTGDLGRFESNKNGLDLYFLGRLDEQVKINGYRVELPEIDSALMKVTNAPSIVVTTLNDENQLKIIGFVEIDNLNSAQVKSELKKLLPKYMIPNEIKTVKEIPKNSNGKFDRNTLKKMYLENRC